MARQSRAIPILLTRPRMQGDRFAADLLARFDDAVVVLHAPLIAPRFFAPPMGRAARAVVFTSETGVQAFSRLSWPEAPRRAYCVGDRTADAAMQAGFVAQSADGDAHALFDLIVAAGEPGPLVHLRGREARGDLAGRLSRAGIATADVVAYAMEAQDLTPPARAILAGPGDVIVPLFSPRTAALFATQAGWAGQAALHIVALSAAVAAELGDLPLASSTVVLHPQGGAMLLALVDIVRRLQLS